LETLFFIFKSKSMFNIKIKSIVSTLIIFIFILSCSKSSDSSTTNTANTTCNANTSFSATILPLFNTSCNVSGCHDGPNAAQLNNFQVVHDNAAQIRASISSGRMPKGGSLTTAQKNAIFCWIDNGAKDN
jgi:hypothetical protein